MVIIINLIIISIILGIIWAYLLPKLTNYIQYRVIYYKPTGKAIGIIFYINNKTEFYYYKHDLNYRIGTLKPYATMRFLKTIQNFVERQFLSFEQFDDYFSNDFYVSSITPLLIFKNASYSIKRELVQSYEYKKYIKEI